MDLALYSRAELKGSDHKPGALPALYCDQSFDVVCFIVFALFRADVRVVDEGKKAELSKLLTKRVTATVPGEKLDNKLAAVTLSADSGECA